MQFCVFVEPQQGATYDTQRRFAQEAERVGFDGFFRSDHYLHMGDDAGTPGPTDAWTTLAGLARETTTLRLGTLVSSVTYRVPGILAIQVAQVDEMSGGRVELGLGTGWFAEEHAAYGIPFPAKRFDLLEEQLAIVTGLWATPEGATFTFEGEHYALADSPALPKPTQDRIPVIVGGAGPKRTPALAAQFATEFNIGFQSEEGIAERFRVVREACEAVDRDPATLSLSVALPALVSRDQETLRRRAAATGVDPVSFAEHNFWGTPEDVAAKVARIEALGADRIYFQVMDMTDLDHLSEIAEALPVR